MKKEKIIYAVLVLLMFVSCEKPVPPPIVSEKNEVEFLRASYYGNQKEYPYLIELSEVGVYDDGCAIKNGYAFDVYLSGEPNKDGKYFFPQVGEYELGNDGIVKIAYIHNVTKNSWEISYTNVDSGKVIISKTDDKYKIEVELPSRKLKYEGIIKSDNYTEPDEVSPQNFALTQSFIHNDGEEWLHNGYDYIYAALNEYGGAVVGTFGFIVPKGSTAIPEGTYLIDNSGNINTIYSPNSYIRLYDDNRNVTFQYSLISGTAEVSSNGLTINAISYNSSTINVDYIGSVAVNVYF